MFAEIDTLIERFERGCLTRRQLVAGLTGLFASAVAGRAAAGGDDQPAGTFKATEINHVALNVTDVARSRAFYEKHLGLAVMSAGERTCFLRCGQDFLALFKAETAGLNHFCFSVEGYEPSNAADRLKAAGLEPRRQANRVYFDDPDGLEVQVSSANDFER